MACFGNAPMVPRESNGGVPVNVQDQVSPALNLFFIKSQAQTTLLSDISLENTTINITNTTGFVAGNRVGLFSGVGYFCFGEQVGAPSGNTITIDTPIDRAFSSATSIVISAVKNMNVNGSVTTQIFQIGPIGSGPGQPMVDITRVIGYMQSASPMDDALFGSLSKLTKGLVLRKNNSVIENIWTAKNNSELATLCAGNFSYTAKAPAGSYGARFVYESAGQEKHGVAIRLDTNDTLELLIQDNLTGLQAFYMMAQGHIVVD